MDFITAEGWQRLKDELSELKLQLPEITRELDEARKQGDLSENFGYHILKKKLQDTNARIADIQHKIASVNIIKHVDTECVSIGCYVKAVEINLNKEYIFRIVGEDDLYQQDDSGIVLITFSSPTAKALLNKKIGDECEVVTPVGEKNYKILQISDSQFE